MNSVADERTDGLNINFALMGKPEILGCSLHEVRQIVDRYEFIDDRLMVDFFQLQLLGDCISFDKGSLGSKSSFVGVEAKFTDALQHEDAAERKERQIDPDTAVEVIERSHHLVPN